MASAFEPFMRSGEGLTGYVHLLLSLYFPPENNDGEPNVPTDGRFQANFLRWLSDDFLCGTSFPSFAVELVSTLQMTSDCGSTGDWKSYPPAILWNAPSASIGREHEDSYYATWNVTYPVYDWGDSGDLQKGLQEALDSKILNRELEMPWEEASLSVLGLERDTFDLPSETTGPVNFINNTNNNNSTGNLREGVLSLDSVTATTVQYVGAILLVVQTMLLIAVHLFGSSYNEKRKNKSMAENKSLLLDAEGLDDMLLLTKEHKMPKSSSLDLLLPTPYIAPPPKVPSSPTRSLVSNASKVSSTNYVGESLLPPMNDDDDDEVSESGTEVVIDESSSVGNGSNHSISSAILLETGAAGSVRSFHSKTIGSIGDGGNDDRSISQNSVGSAVSNRSLGIPTHIGTILGNVDDDDEDNVSDIMIF